MAKFRVRGGCVLCLMCYYECKFGAISIEENVSARIDAEKCKGCGKCAASCQMEAIVPIKENQ